MSVDFKKLDAALFCVQSYLKQVSENNGPYLDHAIYFLDFTTRLRTTIANEMEQSDLIESLPVEPIRKLDSHLADMEDRLRKTPRGKKKKRASDKGRMSKEARAKISKAMRAHHAKRRKAAKRVGR